MKSTILTLAAGGFALSAFLGATPALAVDDALIAAAAKEGTVSWYSSLVESQATRPVANAFQKKYPNIKLEVVTGTATDLLLKISGEARAGSIRADVHHGGSAYSELNKNGHVAAYKADAAKDYPADLKDPNGLWTAEVVFYLVAAVNTDLVSAANTPKSYQDFLDPKWRGKIAWTNGMTQGGPPGFIGTVLKDMGQDKGMDYLTKLSAQKIVSVPANQRVVLDQVIAGEYPIALSTFNNHSDISAAKGAPVKWLPINPVSSTLDTLFLMKAAPHPNAGKLLIEYILSEEGQTVLRDGGNIPANPKVAAAVPAEKPEGGNFKSLTLTPDIIGENLEAWIGVYNKLFK